MKIRNTPTLRDIDILLRELKSGNNQENLEIPMDVNINQFGIEAALIQLVITWSKQSKTDTELVTQISSDHLVRDCKKYLRNMLGVAAFSISKRIKGKDGNVISRRDALTPFIENMENIRNHNYKETWSSAYFGIPCVKTNDKYAEFNVPLYTTGQKVKYEKIYSIVENISSKLCKDIKIETVLENKTKENIAEIITELFENTHEHARHDVKGNEMSKSIRGLVMSAKVMNAESFSKLQDPMMYSFGITWSKYLKEKDLPVLEVSVFDSGPGYASRKSGKDLYYINKEDESDALLECFKKHSSSKKNISSGDGLFKVMRDLKNLRGWFRVRTGRARVEKYFDDGARIDISPSDVKFIPDSYAEGVTFSMVIPLVGSDENI